MSDTPEPEDATTGTKVLAQTPQDRPTPAPKSRGVAKREQLQAEKDKDG